MTARDSTSTTVGRLGFVATMLVIIGANEIRLELVQPADDSDRHHQIEGDWTHDVTMVVFLIYGWTLMRCVQCPLSPRVYPSDETFESVGSAEGPS